MDGPFEPAVQTEAGIHVADEACKDIPGAVLQVGNPAQDPGHGRPCRRRRRAAADRSGRPGLQGLHGAVRRRPGPCRYLRARHRPGVTPLRPARGTGTGRPFRCRDPQGAPCASASIRSDRLDGSVWPVAPLQRHWPSPARRAAPAELGFDGLQSAVSPLGLEFSGKVRGLIGRPVGSRGLMAPPLTAEAQVFVLTEIPMAPVSVLSDRFRLAGRHHRGLSRPAADLGAANRTIEVVGRLVTGSWIDPETGIASQLRRRNAVHCTA